MGAFPQAYGVGSIVSHLLNLCIYTGGQRPHELAASRWNAVNWEEKTLLVVADVSKNKRGHLVPLTESAIEILQRVKEESSSDSAYIFSQRKNADKH